MRKLTDLIDEITYWVDSVKKFSDQDMQLAPLEVIAPYYDQIVRLAHTPIDPNSIERDESSGKIKVKPQFREKTKVISNFIYQWDIRYELDYANSIIHSPDPWVAIQTHKSLPQYLETIALEYLGANLKKGGTIAFLGSGAVPISLIVFSAVFGVNSIGIENEPNSAKVSEKLIDRLGLSQNIKVICGDHFSFPLAHNFDHLIIGFNATPKEEIYHVVKKHVKNATVSHRFLSDDRKIDVSKELNILTIFNNTVHDKNFILPTFRVVHPRIISRNSFAFWE